MPFGEFIHHRVDEKKEFFDILRQDGYKKSEGILYQSRRKIVSLHREM